MTTVRQLLNAALELHTLTRPRTKDGSAPDVEHLYVAEAAKRIADVLTEVANRGDEQQAKDAGQWALDELGYVFVTLSDDMLRYDLLAVRNWLNGLSDEPDEDDLYGRMHDHLHDDDDPF